mmetsp:Transcript_1699/g.1781  ORF Transcript_1699/g.1781 Transcript_1699/m.1781 type:complete len:1183 (-) Transcript_1699:1192-4740(-)
MNEYPVPLTATPKPLAFLIGTVDTDPDLHSRFTKSYLSASKDGDGKDSGLQLQLISVHTEYVFLEKKPPKEYLSVEGILKENWLSKYFGSIPSVVVFFAPLNFDWSTAERVRRETVFADKAIKIKTTLAARETKMIFVMVRVGNGVAEKDVLDERISAYKRLSSSDNKTFFYFNSTDFMNEPQNMKRISKYLREFSSSFYTSHIKRFKSTEKSITDRYRGPFENMLSARFNFKIAFLNEFQGQFLYSLKYYRQSYSALAAWINYVDEEIMIDQVKAVAEFCHFKICNLLLSSDLLEDALQQFKIHVSTFESLFTQQLWRHYTWVVRQYLVFCQLLDKYEVVEQNPMTERVFYWENAARYSLKRLSNFEETYPNKRRSVTEEINGSVPVFRGLTKLPSRFIGSTPLFLDPKFDQLYSTEESSKVYSDYCKEVELSTDCTPLILQYLTKAVEKLPTNRNRKLAHLQLQIAEIHLRQSQQTVAVPLLWESALLFLREKWIEPAKVVLENIIDISISFGAKVDFIQAGFLYYSILLHYPSKRNAIEELHLNLLYIVQINVFSSSKLLTSHFSPILNSPKWSAFSLQISPQLNFPVNLVVHLRSSLIEMFSVDVTFDKSAVTIGEKLNVKIEVCSNFIDEVCFDQMLVHFVDGCGDTTLQNTKSHDKEEIVPILNFQPGVKKTFNIEIDVTEEAFARFLNLEKIFYLESIDLIWLEKSSSSGMVVRLSAFPLDSLYLFPIKSILEPFPRVHEKTIKDALSFAIRQDIISYVTVIKPKGLLKMVTPYGDVTVSKDLLQRIDFSFLSTLTDVENVSVYFSYDSLADANHEEHGLLWYPAFTENDTVFSPIPSSDISKPKLALTVRGKYSKSEIFSLPIFLRSQTLTSIVLKLSVEYTASAIMKKSLVEDFQLKIDVKPAFTVSYSVASDLSFSSSFDVYRSGEANEIFLKSLNTLSMKLRCNIPHSALFIESAGPSQRHETDVNLRKVALNLDEEIVFNARANASGRYDDWKLQWMVPDLDPLDHLNNSYAIDLARLYEPFKRSIQASHQSSSANQSSVATSVIHFPQFKITEIPFEIIISQPLVAYVEGDVEITVSIQSLSLQNEKLVIIMYLLENFLVEGITSTVLEIPTSGFETVTFRVVPLKLGWIYYPRIICRWERGTEPSIDFIDTGERDNERRLLFVAPKPE